jgi:peptidoglycan hydrolase CwlO-like protein
MRRVMGLLLGALLIVAMLSQPTVAAIDDDRPSATDLAALKSKEQAVLADLFALNRDRESIEKRLAEISQDRATTAAQITELQGKIVESEGALAALKTRLAHRLQVMQEGAHLDPFSMLLGSDSLSDFLDRLESLQLLLNHDRHLMAQVNQTKKTLTQQSEALAANERRLGLLADEARSAEAKLSDEIVKRESILAGLQAERGRMEAELAKLEQAWSKIPDLLSSLSDTISSAADKVDWFEPDQVSFSLFPPGATVVVSDGTLNKLLTNGLEFQFKPDAVLLEGDLPGAKLLLQGSFSIVDGKAIRFTPKEMRLNGVLVPADLVAQAVGKKPIQLDLSRWSTPFHLQDLKADSGVLTVQSGL